MPVRHNGDEGCGGDILFRHDQGMRPELDSASRDQLGRQLKQVAQVFVDQPLPEDFVLLLARLRAVEERQA
jgi:hypothetical protein